MSKILKCAGNDDSVTVKADDDGDCATFVFESKDGDRLSEFELKLMDIDSEHLGIPDTGAWGPPPADGWWRVGAGLGGCVGWVVGLTVVILRSSTPPRPPQSTSAS